MKIRTQDELKELLVAQRRRFNGDDPEMECLAKHLTWEKAQAFFPPNARAEEWGAVTPCTPDVLRSELESALAGALDALECMAQRRYRRACGTVAAILWLCSCDELADQARRLEVTAEFAPLARAALAEVPPVEPVEPAA